MVLMRSRHLADIAELSFAARATASFPGAFPPARVGEIDAVLADAGSPGRAGRRFSPASSPAAPRPKLATLIDGAVLNNRPSARRIEALSRRPAHREVDRRFVYVDPKPGMHSELPGRDSMRPAGVFRHRPAQPCRYSAPQPINDNLAAIDTLSAHVRRLRYVVDGMTPEVDAAISSAPSA